MDHKNLTDEALFTFVKNGNEDLFGLLYDRHWSGVYKYMRACVKDEDLAKDLTQDVFFRIWKNRAALEIRSSLHDYIFRSARHRALEYFNSDTVRKKYATHFTHFVSTIDNSTEERSNLHDLEAAIQQAITQLPDKCQTAFRLSRYEYLPLSEIALRMGISKRTAENYITLALKHLRGSLGEFLFIVLWISMHGGEN